MVGTDFSISTCVWKFFWTFRYCIHVIRKPKIWKSWLYFLKLGQIYRFWPCHHYSRSSKPLDSFVFSKNIFDFWRQIWKLNDFLPNFWKISVYGSKSKNPSRPFTRLFIFLSVAKNRLLIPSKTAALCDSWVCVF